MRRHAQFRFLCSLLGGRQPGACCPSTAADWEGVARMAAEQVMPGAIGLELQATGLLSQAPSAVREFFDAVIEQSASVNAVRLARLGEIVRALNASGIVPLLLKGSAAQATGLYQHPGARIAGDLDIGVSPDQWLPAAGILHSLGYSHDLAGAPLASWNAPEKHAREFVRPELNLAIDLHQRTLDSSRAESVVSALIEMDGAPTREQSPALGTFRTLPPNAWIAHLVLTQQWHERGIYLGQLPLRRMYEFVLLERKYRAQIDFPGIAREFAKADFAMEWDTFADALRRLFGLELPALGTPRWIRAAVFARAWLYVGWPAAYGLSYQLGRMARAVLPAGAWKRMDGA